MAQAETRYNADQLTDFAVTLLQHVGLEKSRAVIVAKTLVEADLMGHDTHGLQLLSPYVHELDSGGMEKIGEPEVISDHGSAITWNGRYLPGPWLVHKAIDLTLTRISQHVVVSVAIQRSHHIGCLAAYPERATQKGLMMLLTSSDPRSEIVAPYGGISSVYSPNPIAAGIPTKNEPIIFDISTSVTSYGLVLRRQQEGRNLPHPWLLDTNGRPTNNPGEFLKNPTATILPLGGTDVGYKGFALGIFVEALTSALAGFGRADKPKKWGASVFLQVINPAAFGGYEAFINETQHLADACRNSVPNSDSPPVRLPGTRALQLRAKQKRNGIRLYPAIIPALKACGKKYGISFPEPISAQQ